MLFRSVTLVKGIAVDRQGRLVVYDGTNGQDGSGGFSSTPRVRVFDRNGNFLRFLTPPSPLLDPKRSALVPLRKTDGGKKTELAALRHYHAGFSICKPVRISHNNTPQTPVVTSSGRFIFLTSGDHHSLPRRLFQIHVKDGSVLKNEIIALGSKRTVGKGRHKRVGWNDPLGKAGVRGGVHLAVSPDDKWIYIASPFGYRGRSHQVVFRASLAKSGNPTVFAGVRGKAGKGETHLNQPRGVACDKDGNVYVADSGNSRVQVFSPGGKLIKSIPTPTPQALAVGLKTGAIYATTQTGRGRGTRTTVTRFDGLSASAGKVVLKNSPSRANCIALDESGKTPVLWFTDWWKTVSRWEYREGTLVRTKGNIIGVSPGWPRYWMSAGQRQLLADPKRGLLYCTMPVFNDGVLAWDLRSGRAIWKQGLNARGRKAHGDLLIKQMALGPGGMLYFRGYLGHFLTRYDPDKRKYVGFPENPAQKKNRNRLHGIRTLSNASSRGWADYFTVAPNGDIYYPSGGMHESELKQLEKEGLERPRPAVSKGHFMSAHAGNLLRVYDSQGRL